MRHFSYLRFFLFNLFVVGGLCGASDGDWKDGETKLKVYAADKTSFEVGGWGKTYDDCQDILKEFYDENLIHGPIRINESFFPNSDNLSSKDDLVAQFDELSNSAGTIDAVALGGSVIVMSSGNTVHKMSTAGSSSPVSEEGQHDEGRSVWASRTNWKDYPSLDASSPDDRWEDRDSKRPEIGGVFDKYGDVSSDGKEWLIGAGRLPYGGDRLTTIDTDKEYAHYIRDSVTKETFFDGHSRGVVDLAVGKNDVGYLVVEDMLWGTDEGGAAVYDIWLQSGLDQDSATYTNIGTPDGTSGRYMLSMGNDDVLWALDVDSGSALYRLKGDNWELFGLPDAKIVRFSVGRFEAGKMICLADDGMLYLLSSSTTEEWQSMEMKVLDAAINASGDLVVLSGERDVYYLAGSGLSDAMTELYAVIGDDIVGVPLTLGSQSGKLIALDSSGTAQFNDTFSAADPLAQIILELVDKSQNLYRLKTESGDYIGTREKTSSEGDDTARDGTLLRSGAGETDAEFYMETISGSLYLKSKATDGYLTEIAGSGLGSVDPDYEFNPFSDPKTSLGFTVVSFVLTDLKDARDEDDSARIGTYYDVIHGSDLSTSGEKVTFVREIKHFWDELESGLSPVDGTKFGQAVAKAQDSLGSLSSVSLILTELAAVAVTDTALATDLLTFLTDGGSDSRQVVVGSLSGKVLVIDKSGIGRMQETSGADPAAELTMAILGDEGNEVLAFAYDDKAMMARTKLAHEEAGDATEGVLFRTNNDDIGSESLEDEPTVQFYPVVEDGKLYLQSVQIEGDGEGKLRGYLTEVSGGGLAVVDPSSNFEPFVDSQTTLGINLVSAALIALGRAREMDDDKFVYDDITRVAAYQKLINIQDESNVASISGATIPELLTGASLESLGEKFTFVRELKVFLDDLATRDAVLSPEAAQGMGEIVASARVQFASTSELISLLNVIGEKVESGLGLIPTNFAFNIEVLKGMENTLDSDSQRSAFMMTLEQFVQDRVDGELSADAYDDFVLWLKQTVLANEDLDTDEIEKAIAGLESPISVTERIARLTRLSNALSLDAGQQGDAIQDQIAALFTIDNELDPRVSPKDIRELKEALSMLKVAHEITPDDLDENTTVDSVLAVYPTFAQFITACRMQINTFHSDDKGLWDSSRDMAPYDSSESQDNKLYSYSLQDFWDVVSRWRDWSPKEVGDYAAVDALLKQVKASFLNVSEQIFSSQIKTIDEDLEEVDGKIG